VLDNVLLNTTHGVTPLRLRAQFDKDFATSIKPGNPAFSKTLLSDQIGTTTGNPQNPLDILSSRSEAAPFDRDFPIALNHPEKAPAYIRPISLSADSDHLHHQLPPKTPPLKNQTIKTSNRAPICPYF
jgi:hypothetical protein